MTETETLKGLVSAVIEGACGDYVRIDTASFERNCRARQRLEAFFRSNRFRLYTDDNIDPEYLIAELKKKREWNDLIRVAVIERFGSFKRFAEVLYPGNQAKRRFSGQEAKYWLKSSKYPPDFMKWEAALGITRCKCGTVHRGKRCPECGEKVKE